MSSSQHATKPGLLPLPNGDKQLVLGMVLFDGFELLDVFGPLEMFGILKDKVRILIIGEKPGSVKSSAGPAVLIETTLAENQATDILMIPGGIGTRSLISNPAFIDEFRKLAAATEHVASICTGAAILAKTGLIDDLKATTNKKAFNWVITHGEKVNWVKQARWVEDGKFFTAAGVAAGIDMALALIEKLFGKDTAMYVANNAEHEWNSDPHHDPFAALNGLSD